MGHAVPYGVAMWGKLSRMVVLMLVGAGCATTGTPATVPSSLPATTTTAVVTTTTLLPSTTTTAATTTTVDRIAEIEAVFQDLEERRLQALYEGDEEAFKSLFANNEYMERSLGAFDVVEFEDDPSSPSVVVVEVLWDSAACVAARVLFPATNEVVGSEERIRILVLEKRDEAWGFSYSGEGWTCEGPHPFLP
jgi:hypothetical protein